VGGRFIGRLQPNESLDKSASHSDAWPNEQFDFNDWLDKGNVQNAGMARLGQLAKLDFEGFS